MAIAGSDCYHFGFLNANNMSQRTANLNESIEIDLKLKVTIKNFSNHNGFFNGQINKGIEEFKENIKTELKFIIEGEHLQQEFLQTVDFVTYEVEAE